MMRRAWLAALGSLGLGLAMALPVAGQVTADHAVSGALPPVTCAAAEARVLTAETPAGWTSFSGVWLGWGEPLNSYTNPVTLTFTTTSGLAAGSYYHLTLGCGAAAPTSQQVTVAPWPEGRCWTTPAGFFCLADVDSGATGLVIVAHYTFSGAPCGGQTISYRQQWRLCDLVGACRTGFYVGALGPVSGPPPTPVPSQPTPTPPAYPAPTPGPYPAPLSADWFQFSGQVGRLSPALGWGWLALLAGWWGWQQRGRLSSVDLGNRARFLYNVRHYWRGRSGGNDAATD